MGCSARVRSLALWARRGKSRSHVAARRSVTLVLVMSPGQAGRSKEYWRGRSSLRLATISVTTGASEATSRLTVCTEPLVRGTRARSCRESSSPGVALGARCLRGADLDGGRAAHRLSKRRILKRLAPFRRPEAFAERSLQSGPRNVLPGARAPSGAETLTKRGLGTPCSDLLFHLPAELRRSARVGHRWISSGGGKARHLRGASVLGCGFAHLARSRRGRGGRHVRGRSSAMTTRHGHPQVVSRWGGDPEAWWSKDELRCS